MLNACEPTMQLGGYLKNHNRHPEPILPVPRQTNANARYVYHPLLLKTPNDSLLQLFTPVSQPMVPILTKDASAFLSSPIGVSSSPLPFIDEFGATISMWSPQAIYQLVFLPAKLLRLCLSDNLSTSIDPKRVRGLVNVRRRSRSGCRFRPCPHLSFMIPLPLSYHPLPFCYLSFVRCSFSSSPCMIGSFFGSCPPPSFMEMGIGKPVRDFGEPTHFRMLTICGGFGLATAMMLFSSNRVGLTPPIPLALDYTFCHNHVWRWGATPVQ